MVKKQNSGFLDFVHLSFWGLVTLGIIDFFGGGGISSGLLFSIVGAGVSFIVLNQ